MSPRRSHPMLALLPGLFLGACGHISNDPILDDAAFLAALPSAADLGPFRPDGTPPTDESGLTGSRPLPVDDPFDRAMEVSADDHAREDAHGRTTHRRNNALESASFAPAPFTEAPEVPGTYPTGTGDVVQPQTVDPDGGPDDDVAPDEAVRARLAPRSQSDEMFDYLTTQMNAIYAVADLMRATPPSVTDEDARAWDDVVWRGTTVSADIDAVEGDRYAWTFTSRTDRGFAEGTWTAAPPAGEWQGWLALDASAWSELFGVAGAGVMGVDYDTRSGAELQLSFLGSSYADDDNQCSVVPILRWPTDLVPGRVLLGDVQRYRYVQGEGDYQFSTLRRHGCGDPAISTVRVRWTAEGGRADAWIRVGATAWTRWSECWTGPNDRGPLVYEAILDGGEEDTVLDETGDRSACVYADFGEVDPEVATGAGG